jgi:hypothetical protein
VWTIRSTVAARCFLVLCLVSIGACGHPAIDAAFEQQAYVKASNTGSWDFFGYSIALSADGTTLAVGAFGEASDATGVDGDQTSNSAENAGAVYVFVRTGLAWAQQTYIKASNTGAGDRVGGSLALSADGSTLAVGAFTESSAATGVDGDESDNSAMDSGAVYVFTRDATTWSQQAYLKPSNTDAGDQFGYSVGLSADGNTLAVGAIFEASSATGINGNETDNSAEASGAGYVFSRSGTTWSQQAYLKASNTGAWDQFGYSVALSADASTLAVGAWLESSAATGVDGEQADDSAYESGAAYVYTRAGTTWSQQAYVKASNTDAEDFFGISLSLSADGNVLAVGADEEDSGAIGINEDQTNNAAKASGAAYVLTRIGTQWAQEAYLKSSNADSGDLFGFSVALSADGSTLAVGAWGEDSDATGAGGDQSDNSKEGSGAVYVLTRTQNAWEQQAYVKASNTGIGDLFGFVVALSGDGSTVAVGAYSEASSATGINGNQGDDKTDVAGAAYVFAAR